MIRALLLCAVALSIQAQSLEGFWAYEAKFGPKLRGELTVTRDKAGWRAAIGGQETKSADLRFTFDGGGFRGTLAGRSIDGYWLQPAGEISQAQSTPVILRRAGRNVWRGTVVPAEDAFTIYLKVFRNQDGALVGAFRNPEWNSNAGTTQFRVAQEGETVRFTAGQGAGQITREAKLLQSPERLQMAWSDINRTVELTRRTPEQVTSFFPRPPGEPKYVYRKPAAIADGWKTARASEVELDEAALAKLVQRLIDADPAARRPSLIHSLLVAKDGRLVLEEYFFGFGRETPHDLRSAGKTFSSILLGAAMRNGAKLSPDSRVYEVMKGLGPFANPDPRKAQITLTHLMTHSAGLACNDNDDNSPGNEGTMWQQKEQPNFWKYTLDLPMAHDPGTRYAYCSANTNLVGGALTTATKTWLPELFDRTIARPLQFRRYHWNLFPTGDGYLGGGAYLRPRDLLKVGQMFLDGGVWNGRRIVAEQWIEQSTAPRIEITPKTTGLTEEEFGNFYGGGVDGYAWHLHSINAGGRAYRTYQASGNGGQVLIVMPELGLTVVFTAGNYGQGGIWGRWGQEIVGGEIIPAIGK
jgi:CubicO group peptidase (beta-lactamase class C family)